MKPLVSSVLFCAVVQLCHGNSMSSAAKVSDTTKAGGSTKTDSDSTSSKVTSGHTRPKFRRGTMNSVPNFHELVKCTTFIDKTGLIEEFFENSGFRQYHLITTPHKFGKTLNLNMMKTFLQLESDSDETKDIFVNSNITFKITPLLQQKDSKLMKHYRSYTVIYVNFRSIESDNTDYLKGLRKNVRKAFIQHAWLYDVLIKRNATEVDSQLKFMKKVLDGNLNDTDLPDFLIVLSDLLYYHNDRPIFLLIDDYDGPVIDAIEYEFSIESPIKLINEMFARVFSPDHNKVRYALLTGTFNLFEKSKFSHVKHWNFLDNQHFSTYFGFTEPEVIELLHRHGVGSSEVKAVRRYYGGYNVSFSSMRIYNPYSIVNYLSSRGPSDPHHPLDNYWAECSENRYFLNFFKNHKKYGDLLLKIIELKKVRFALRKYWDFEALETVNEVSKIKPELTDYSVDVILSSLFHNGFLCYADKPDIFRFPNKEVENHIKHLLSNSDKDFVINSKDVELKLSPAKYHKFKAKIEAFREMNQDESDSISVSDDEYETSEEPTTETARLS